MISQSSPDSSTVVYIADQDTDDVFELYSVALADGEVTKLSDALVEGGDLVPVADLPLAALVFVEQLIQDAAAASREFELVGQRISVSGQRARARSLSGNRHPGPKPQEEPGGREGDGPGADVLHGRSSAPAR